MFHGCSTVPVNHRYKGNKVCMKLEPKKKTVEWNVIQSQCKPSRFFIFCIIYVSIGLRKEVEETFVEQLYRSQSCQAL